MSFPHQDWTPVVFKTHNSHRQANSKDAIKQAQRTGNLETLSRDHDREERDRARKVDAETAVLPKLSLTMRKLMTEARTKKGLSRDQLAQRLNVKPKIIGDLESGAVITDPSVLVKVRRELGVPQLRFEG